MSRRGDIAPPHREGEGAMFSLRLRHEFQTSQMPGTQVNLDEFVHASTNNTILEITYPTADVRKALRAVASPDSRPIVIIGERGRGKSHILALLHYAFEKPDQVMKWIRQWENDVDDPSFGQLTLPSGFAPISVVMSNQEFANLWDPIFKLHREGEWLRGRFEESGTTVPSRSLMEEAFTNQPTALIFDELQTWYDTLSSIPPGGSPRELAFNFIQILAEIASSRPELLRLVVSVRNSETDAYRQIHRNNPMLVDFKGVSAREDRIRLTQHRLFDNYRQIPPSDIEEAVCSYADERVRLLFTQQAGPAQDQARAEVVKTWPFAPELLDVLEDEILMSAAAQDTRDLMRILARVYKARGDQVPILTVADINITDKMGGGADLASMVDAVAYVGSRLREVAQRNLESIDDQGLQLPHAVEIVSALWVRSLAQGPRAGATSRQLQLDVTRDTALDDNAFAEELEKLKDASFNIHPVGDRLVFRQEENPQSKLLASSRNDKLFSREQDIDYLQRSIAQALSPMDTATMVVSRLIVMGPNWDTQPWIDQRQEDLPAEWREPIVIVIPEVASHEKLARWLKDNVASRRNLVRFLLPGVTRGNPYQNRELRELARCAYLAEDWGRSDSQYLQLRPTYQRPLREHLSRWFDRLAVLATWDYVTLNSTTFVTDTISNDGQGLLKAIEDHIERAIFEPEVFRQYVLKRAETRDSALEIIATVMEPPTSPDVQAIPFLGETSLYERILRMVADGDIILNYEGNWIRRRPDDIDSQAAFNRIRSKAFVTGKYLQNITVAPSSAAPAEPDVPEPAIWEKGSGYHPNPISKQGAESTDNEPPVNWSPTPVVERKLKTLASAGSRSQINLLGDLHGWGLSDTTTLQNVRLEGSRMTVQQLKDLLKRFPPSILFKLEILIEEQES